MKRIGNVYSRICSVDNLRMADKKARRCKGWQYGVQVFDRDSEEKLKRLHEVLLSKTYKTSQYTVFKIYEPKERDVYRLPYYPDRIVHHAIMNVIGDAFVSTFTSDTFSCIKKRGIHGAARKLKRSLKDRVGTQYCLKLDIKKFYPNVNHDVLKSLVRKKFKDQDLLWLLDEIIDSADGLPIGNYLSQYLANFYLTYFDHWIKEDRKTRHYFRYADDIVILAETKEELHGLLADIKKYLYEKLKLEVKNNYQVFPVSSRGIDFVGYVFYHTHVVLRKKIKKNFARMLKNRRNKNSIDSYMGWLKHCNGYNLQKKLLK